MTLRQWRWVHCSVSGNFRCGKPCVPPLWPLPGMYVLPCSHKSLFSSFWDLNHRRLLAGSPGSCPIPLLPPPSNIFSSSVGIPLALPSARPGACNVCSPIGMVLPCKQPPVGPFLPGLQASPDLPSVVYSTKSQIAQPHPINVPKPPPPSVDTCLTEGGKVPGKTSSHSPLKPLVTPLPPTPAHLLPMASTMRGIPLSIEVSTPIAHGATC